MNDNQDKNESQWFCNEWTLRVAYSQFKRDIHVRYLVSKFNSGMEILYKVNEI